MTRNEIEKRAEIYADMYDWAKEWKSVWASGAIEVSNAQLEEIKKKIGYRSYDVDGNPCVIEVQKLQQYLTSLKIKPVMNTESTKPEDKEAPKAWEIVEFQKTLPDSRTLDEKISDERFEEIQRLKSEVERLKEQLKTAIPFLSNTFPHIAEEIKSTLQNSGQ